MKLMTFVLLAVFLQVSAGSYSQNNLSLSLKNAPIEKVFKEIQNQSDYQFFYNDKIVKNAKKVTINVKNASLQAVLQLCFKEQPFTYVIDNKQIIIKTKELIKVVQLPQDDAPLLAEIKGRVTDANGKPLAGATIKLKGTDFTTVANENGEFSLSYNGNAGVLVVSFVGFETTETRFSKGNTVAVVLKQKETKIDEVLVVGYGTVRKKDLTGSVASVQMKDQDKTPIIGTEQLLEGQVSGVQVSQNQSQPGGTSFSIRIRGTNSINSSSEPLFVVDGYAGGDIATLNPSDIASIEVLKDGSATAIYGSRGANGVILITTKRGKFSGHSISVNAYTGVQQITKTYKMMNAAQFGTFLNKVQSEVNDQNGTNDPLPYTENEIKSFGKGTDWQDEIFRQAQISNASIAFSGGDEKSRHYLSFNYFDQKGIILGSDYKRGTIRFNIDKNISKKLTFSFSSQISYDYQNATAVNTYGGANTPSVLWDAVRFNPILPARDANGFLTYQNNPLPFVEPLGNPLGFIKKATDATYYFRSFVNAYAEYEIIKDLKLKSSFGVNYNNGGNKYFLPASLFVGAPTGGFASQNASQGYDWLNENTISYNKDFHNQSVNFVGGFTFQKAHSKYFGTSVNSLVTDNLGADNLGVGSNALPIADFRENVLASFFGRVNYQLMNKYLFTATMRADGSSRFGANNKWGYFPSGAVAWRISEEKFMKGIKVINDFKIRGSYGVTGNQEIGSYNTLSTYSTLSPSQYFGHETNYNLGQTPVPVVGFASDRIPNPNLKWESTTSTDVGIDISLFNSRITFTGDYYYKKTTNLLLFKGIPQTSGFSSILSNIGSVRNKGFEFSLNTKNFAGNNFTWTTMLNFSKNYNKILDLGNDADIYVGDLSNSIFPSGSVNSAVLRKGESIGSFFGYVFDGIWQTPEQITASGTQQAVLPGDPIYKDINNDGALDDQDRIILGSALPKFTYAIGNTFTYKRFSLNAFLQGVYGNKILNVNRYEIESGTTGFNKLAKVATQSWNGPGTSNTLPRVSSTLRRGTGVTSDVLEDGSFLRLKTLNVSYDIPLSHTSGIFKSAVVYVTGQNLFTITKYTGYDPEVNSFTTNNALSLGTDYNAYPNYRSYLLGVKFGF